MKRDYSEFSNISIYDTRMILKDSYEGKVLDKNKITTLEELFKRYDEDTINYGPKMCYGNNHLPAQIRGIIRLLRWKYLNENLIIDEVFEKQYTIPLNFKASYPVPCLRARNGKYLSDSSKNIDTDFKQIGLSEKEINVLIYQIVKNKVEESFGLLDTIRLVRNHDFPKNPMFSMYDWTNEEINVFEEKLILIVKYYNKMLKPEILESLEDLKKEAKFLEEQLKCIMTKKEMIQSKIDSIGIQMVDDKFFAR